MPFDLLGAVLSTATFFGIYALLSLSLNFQYGITGLPNFGLVLFYGIGAFASGVISATALTWVATGRASPYCNVLAGGPRMGLAASDPALAIGVFLLGIIVAGIVAGLFGYILSYPAIRIEEEWYLALVLLIAAEIVRVVARNYDGFGSICGFNGLGGIPGPFQWLPSVTGQSIAFALVGLALVATAYLYFERELNSPYGRMLKSIRDDHIAARSLGKNVGRVRIQVMIIGSVFAGIAGGLFTYYSNYVSPDNFVSIVTFNVWVMIVLGGLGNNKGALLGTLIVISLQKITSVLAITLPIPNASLELNYSTYIIEGVIFLLLLMYKPQGLVPEKSVKTPAEIALV